MYDNILNFILNLLFLLKCKFSQPLRCCGFTLESQLFAQIAFHWLSPKNDYFPVECDVFSLHNGSHFNGC